MSNKFVCLHATDPFSGEDDAFNPIYVRPGNVAHVETYSGMFPLQAYGPDGKLVLTGKHREVFGIGMVILYCGGTRIVRETAEEILEIIDDSEKEF